MSERLTIYSTQWCGYCHRLMRQLERAEIEFDVIDMEVTAGAVEYVMSVNGGNQTVPTVVLPDGGVLTNPSIAQLVDRLAA